ncbi:MAG: amidase [Alphaproteobacteria bacterium]|nr:amidase [Alphaproteobacteria bacterium]
MAARDKPLKQLSAWDIVDGIGAGRFTALEVTEACLAQIGAREETVRAWAYLDAEGALARARELDGGPTAGPLHGVPVGIKDVFDTFDMPTEMGSPIYRGYRPVADASVVATLRAAGAVILGKTVTCEFAGMHPGVTANPHDPTRTPGGSSSGSAAAVADHMVPLALGTQTGGSVLRPASFCGVVGFKPSYGAISRVGLKLAAESLDTVGLLARSVDDAALGYDVLAGRRPQRRVETPEAPVIGLCRTFLWETAEADSREAIADAGARLAEAGAAVEEVTMADDFARLAEARDIVNAVERARAMAFEWQHHRAEISEDLSATLAEGLATAPEAYAEALAVAEGLRGRLDELFGPCDGLLAPCVPGVAPVGFERTGDPALQGLWTILHVPTITLPTHRGAEGLPLGIQLVGRPHGDEALLGLARWAMAHLSAP